MSSDFILKVEDLKTYFDVAKGRQKSVVKAVDGVSFAVRHGETVGLVGESGCGKSTIGRTIMRFNQPTAGKIYLDGDDITSCDMAPYRRRCRWCFRTRIPRSTRECPSTTSSASRWTSSIRR